MDESLVVSKVNVPEIKKDEIDLRSLFKRYPVIDGELNVVRGYRLNRIEQRIVDVWCETLSLKECIKGVGELLGKEVKRDFVVRRMKKGHIKEIIGRKMEQKALLMGFDRDKWRQLGIEAMLGLKKIDAEIWKELGKSDGFYVKGEGEGNGGVTVNNQILFTQKDGSL